MKINNSAMITMMDTYSGDVMLLSTDISINNKKIMILRNVS